MMKRTIISCLAVLLTMVGAKADNLSVEAVEIEPGATTTVGISLTNTENNLVSFQMDLTLPEGISLNKANCVLTSRITDVDQELVIGKQGEHVYRLTSASFNLTPIAGTNGELITLSITASNTFAGGQATISNIVFANRNSETINIPSTNFNITVPTPASPNIVFADANVKAICVANWDTNGDGELSEAEAAAVTDLGEAFKDNYDITSFNELSYFTGLTSIGDRTFYKCSSLTDISIPSSVTTIGDYAFYYCLGLTTLPALNNVTTIGDNAFDCCGGLVSIFIPVSVKSFGRNVFGDCHNITSIEVENGNPKFDSRNNCNAIIETGTNTLVIGCQNTIIPTDVTAIGQNAFRTCLGLTSITIPVSVTSIGNEAFYYCNNLTSINVPKNVNDIVGTPFGFCISMATITVDAENTKYDSRDNCNAIIETETNTLIAGCKTTEIPNSVTAIGAIAFWGSQELTSIIIPNSVTSIGEWSFFATPNLTSVTVGNPSPVAIAENTFSNRANATLCVPAGAKAAYQAAAYWNEFKEIVELDEDAKVENNMLVEDATIVIGSEGKLSVRLTNNQQILGFSADVHLPNGVTPKTDGSGNMIITTASRVPVTVMGNVTSDGVAHFAILTNGTPIAGNDGEIFSFEIQADGAMTAGNYEVQLTNIKLVNSELKVVMPDNDTATLAVKEAEPGDANGDGEIDVDDASMIIYFMLGRITGVNPAWADINGDGDVDILDATLVIYRLLGRY